MIVKLSQPVTSPALLRRLNSQHVLRAIRDAGPVSRAEVADTTGLSKPTVKEVVELLLAAGYVREAAADGNRPPRPGRRPRLLTFTADLGHVLGIDIGANKILALVADLDGTVIASERRRTAPGERADADELLEAVRATAKAALRTAAVERERLKAVTVGTPGVVDLVSGLIALAPQLPGLEGVSLGRRLEGSFSCPVLVENEVHLSVLAERWRGAAQGIDDAVYVQIGVGIGGGILIGGEVYRGATGAAGEIGYLPFADPDGGRDGLGPFEHAAGGSAFARLAGRAGVGLDAEAVFAAAAGGDEAAAEVLGELLDRLAQGIAAVVCVLDPATVIVGGGVSRAGEPLRGPLERRLRELVPVPPRVVLSTLGDESVALGAVRRAVQQVDRDLFAFAGEP